MHTLRPVTRYAAALLLFLQCVLPACVSVADGWASRAGGATTPHVEQLGGPGNCATVHPADCDLCTFVQLAVSTAPSMARDGVFRTTCGTPVSHARAIATSPFRSGFSSRAPPHSSA